MQCLLLKRLRVSCFSASSINLSVTHKYLSLSRYVAYIPIQIHDILYLHTDNAGYSIDHFERSCKKTHVISEILSCCRTALVFEIQIPFKKQWWKEDIAVWEFPLTKSLDRHILSISHSCMHTLIWWMRNIIHQSMNYYDSGI